MLLVPSDALRQRRPDEHFAGEVEAARDAGIEVALVDHDALAGGDTERGVTRVPAGADAVYRGWMLDAGRYAEMAAVLAARGVTLRTDAGQYRRAHELPGWYAAIARDTPETVWTTGDGREAFHKACGELGGGPAVLRDFTKSMKHYWHEAAFVPDVSDGDAAWEVASRFRELRGDGFTGGFVLRRFESFTGAEVRTWWVGGVCRLVTAHPDTPDDLPPDGVVLPDLGGVDLPFVTVDLALRADGRWRVIEIGDGQVSDRPRSVPPQELIRALSGR